MSTGTPDVDALANDEIEVHVEDDGSDPLAPVEAPVAASATAVEPWRDEARAWEREAAIAPAPLAARLYLQAGRLHAKGGDTDTAEALHRRAIEVDPTYRPALTNLRRLHAARGAWLEAAADDEAELRFAKDPSSRFELLRSRATVLARKANRPDLAAEAFTQALGIAPEHPALLSWAIGEARQKGDVAAQIDLHLRFVKGVRDERAKAKHLARAAFLQEQLGDGAAAATTREALLQADPLDLEAQAAALPKLFGSNAADALVRVARAEVDSSSGSPTRVRLARMLVDRKHALDEAAEVLQSAREINPRDMAALEGLIAVAELRGDGAALEKHLQARLDSGRDPLDKTWAALRLARIAEEKGEGENARARYERVLELAPDHAEAKAAIERLVQATASADEKIERQAAAAASADPAAKVEALWRLASMLAQAGRADDAAARLTELLALAPAHLAARNAVVRLHAAAGRFSEVAALWEREGAASDSDEGRREAFLELAGVRETALEDAAGALVAYRAAFEVGADAVSLAGVLRLSRRVNDPASEAWALERLANGTVPPAPAPSARQRITWLERAAALREAAGEAEAARQLHEAVLEIDAAYAPSRAALRGGILDEPLPSLEEAKALEGAAKVAAITELARTAASEAREAALAALVEAVPTHPTAWADLARVREAKGDVAGAIAALEAYAGLVTDRISKADKQFRAAELAEQQLQDAALAERLVDATVATHPRHAGGWHLLARLALARGDAARAGAALEQEAAVTQLKDCLLAQRRLARLLSERLGDKARALVLLKDIAEADPADIGALGDLELLLGETGDVVKSAELRSKLAARCGDVRAAAAMRTSAAEDRLAAGDIDGGVAEYRRALALDGRNRAAADEILRVMRERGDRAGMLDAYQRIAPYQDNHSQAVLLQMRAELHEEDGQPQLAQRCYRDAIAADELQLPALRSARRLAEAAGEWNEARALLAQEGDAHADPDEGVALLVRAGELAETGHALEQAEAHYLRALEKKPGEPKALERIGALLRPQGRFGELVTIYEREGEATEGPRSAALYAEAAWLRYEKLGEERRAAVPLNRALARDPACLRAAELKATIAIAEGRPEEAEEALEAAAKAADPVNRPRLLVRLAEARLAAGKGTGALEAAQAAAEADPTSLAALELVAKSALASKAFLVAVATAEKLLGLAQDIVNGNRYAKLAGHVRRLAGDRDGASGLYRRALTLLPGDKEAIEGLELTHLEGHDFAGLASAYEQLAAGSAPQEALQYLGRAAGVWDKAKAPDKAAAVWRAALKTEPANVALRLSLSRTLASTPSTRAEAAVELRGLLVQDWRQAEALRELAALFEADGRRDAAFVATACLVALQLATPDEQARYAELAGRLPPGPSASLAPEDVELLVHPVERASAVRELLVPVQETVAKVVVGNLEARGLGRGDRVKGDLRSVADRIAKVFGVPEFDLMQAVREPGRAWVENTVPPTLVLGANVAQSDVGGLLFTLGMLLGRVRARTQAMFFAQPIEIANLSAELLRQVDPAFQRFGTRNEELARVVAKNLSRTERKAVEAVFPRFAGPVNFGAYTQAIAWTSHRFGLVTAGDPAAALGALGRTFGVLPERPEVRELVTFAVSEEHLALRQKLKLSVA